METTTPKTLCNHLEETHMDSLSCKDDIALAAGRRARLDKMEDAALASARTAAADGDFDAVEAHLHTCALLDEAEGREDAALAAANERDVEHIRAAMTLGQRLRALLTGRKRSAA